MDVISKKDAKTFFDAGFDKGVSCDPVISEYIKQPVDFETLYSRYSIKREQIRPIINWEDADAEAQEYAERESNELNIGYEYWQNYKNYLQQNFNLIKKPIS